MATLNIDWNLIDTTKPIDGDTILVYLIDRSGSMMSCWEPTIGGLNDDIGLQQKEDDGKTEAVFYFFDSQWADKYGDDKETKIVKTFEGPLTEAKTFEMGHSDYSPRGGTPLFDSVGRMIDEVTQRVEATESGVNVIVSIYTDGGNTDHQGYSSDQVKMMVEECEGKGWTFSYFGANQDAWKVASSFGIKKGNAMNYSTSNMENVMRSASVARSVHTKMAKSALASGSLYTSSAFFSEAGQSEEDYV